MPSENPIAGVPLHARLETLARSAWSGAVRVHGTKDSGSIYLVDGRTVHAECGRVRGEFAYWLLMGMPSARIELEAGTASPHYTISRPLELNPSGGTDRALERLSSPLRAELPGAAEELDERAQPAGIGGLGRLQVAGLALAAGVALGALLFSGSSPDPLPLPPPAPPSPAAAPAAKPAAPAAAPRGGERSDVAARAPLSSATDTRPAAPEPARSDPPRAPLPADVDAGAADTAVEISALDGDDGEPPRVLESPAAAHPDSPLGLAPEIVVRLRVGRDGRVAEASVYGSQPERAAFEESALQAARGYRFSPARRAGKPVSVWLNLPVRVP